MVSEGLIKYTIANENMVGSFSNYYGNIDAKTPVSFPQRVAWGIRKSSPQLKTYIDGWIHNLKKDNKPYYNVVYKKYFKNRTAFSTRMNSQYFSHTSGGISPMPSATAWKSTVALAMAASGRLLSPNSDWWLC